MFTTVLVIGSGVFGSAVAESIMLSNSSVNVFLLGHDKPALENIDNVLQGHVYTGVLSDISKITTQYNVEYVFVAVSALHVRDVMELLYHSIGEGKPVVLIMSKGVHSADSSLCSEYFATMYQDKFADMALMYAPSFAKDVMRNHHICYTVCSVYGNTHLSKSLMNLLNNKHTVMDAKCAAYILEIFILYKSVSAIYCGYHYACNGNSESVRGGEFSRCVEEAICFAHSYAICKGDKVSLADCAEYLTSSSVMGDMAMTCFSRTSRNHQYGEYIANGERAMAESIGTVEGVEVAKWLMLTAKKNNILQTYVVSCVAELV